MKKIVGVIVLSLVLVSSAFAQGKLKRSPSAGKLNVGKDIRTTNALGQDVKWGSQVHNRKTIEGIRAGVAHDGSAIKSKIDTGKH